jgi:hypothetical protein
MYLSDIKTAVKMLFDDPDLDDDTITAAANWFINRLFTTYRLRMAEASTTLYGNQGVSIVPFPADYLTRIAIYSTTPRVFNMREGFEEYETFMSNYSNFATASPAQAYAWTEYGKVMRFSNPLNVPHIFQVDYLRTPLVMAEDGDECELGAVWAELVAKGTQIGIMEINEDYNEADQLWNGTRFQRLLTSFISQEGRGGGKTGPRVVLRTNRGRGQWRADKDF